MYKVTIEDLETIKKALKKSKKVLENTPEPNLKSTAIQNAISQNQKAIELIDDEYLNKKLHYL